MSGWTAVSLATYGTPYEEIVQGLVQSCRECGVPLRVYYKPARGTWRQNLDWKSAVILQAMEEHPGRDVVFIDADAKVRSYPSKFDELSQAREYDVAACLFRGSRLERDELLSGTLWVSNSEAGRELVRLWDAEGRAAQNVRHQKCLARVLARHPGRWRLCRLDEAYTRIFDHPGMRGVVPVIEHFQASRRTRRVLRPAGPFGG